MATMYRKGYSLEKMLVDRLNKTGFWYAQRGPSSKGVDVIASSRKYYKTIFMECKNTDAKVFSVEKEQILDLAKKAYIGNAIPYLCIHWRGRTHKDDARRKLMTLYNMDHLTRRTESTDGKTLTFKPYEYSETFEEVFEA